MKNKFLSRRQFLSKCSILGISGYFFMPPFFNQTKQDKQIGFWHDFSPEEKEIINYSELVKLFSEIDYRKYSCAESTLLAILRYINKPEEFVQAAAGFGGGLGHGELCGMITGGTMGLGIVAHKYLKNQNEINEYIEYARDDYINWWKSKAPVRCDQLIQRYQGVKDYLRMGKRATAKLDELIRIIKT